MNREAEWRGYFYMCYCQCLPLPLYCVVMKLRGRQFQGPYRDLFFI